jgi:hypothetical protein
MALALSAAEIDALNSDTQRIGVFFRMATNPVSRLWLGVGDCKVDINALDASAQIYSGCGQLRDVPAFQQLINGVAERLTFYVSGVSKDTLALASTAAPGVKDTPIAIGIGFFDAAWQQLGVPKWLWSGHADFVTLNQQSDKSGNGITRVIELSVGSLFTGRRRRGLSYLTDKDQQTRHPGDRFCERTVVYSQFEKVWPVFGP